MVYAARVIAVILLAFGLLWLAGWWWEAGEPVQMTVWFAIVLLAPALALALLFPSVESVAKGVSLYLALALAAAVTAAAVFSVSAAVERGFRQWESRDRVLTRDIWFTQKALGWFHEAEGRYPQGVSEDAGVQQWVDLIKQYCQERDIEVAEVRLPGDEAGEEGERRELLIAADEEGKTLVVIYSDGTFGVSRRLLTRRAKRVSEEMEILR